MQSLKAMKLLRSHVAWGFGAMIFGTVVALVLGFLYYNTPGVQQRVAFYTDDASSIRIGDEVRMAGITVGRVSNLSLESDHVRVDSVLDDGAFVGDQSQVDVRMLTVVGGYYVNIASMGAVSLGSNPIPLSRVHMPYDLISALTDSAKIATDVKPPPVKESLDQIAQGLTGSNVQVVATAIDAGNTLMSTVERQRGQVTQILDLSEEYIRALAAYRDKFAQLVRKVSILTQTLVIYDTGFSNTLKGLGDVVLALKPVSEFYENHQLEFIEKVREFLHKGNLFVERNGLTIRALKRFQNLMDRVLDAQNAEPALLATDICVPIPGSAC